MDIGLLTKRMWKRHVHHARSMEVPSGILNMDYGDIDFALLGTRNPREKHVSPNYAPPYRLRDIKGVLRIHNQFIY